MSLAEYLEARRQISTAFQVAKAACGVDTPIRRELCIVDAMGKDWVAKADLEVAYRSGPRTRAEASQARVDARFWLARERCDDGTLDDRQACLQQAKSMRLAAGISIAAQRKTEEDEETCASEAAAGGRPASQACRSGSEARRRAGRGTPP